MLRDQGLASITTARAAHRHLVQERYPAFRGLNLTLAVREGIVKISRDPLPAPSPGTGRIPPGDVPPSSSTDRSSRRSSAYLTADLDDGLDSGILNLEQVRDGVPLFRRFHDGVLNDYPAAASKITAYQTLKRILNALVTDLMIEVSARVTAIGAATLQEIRQAPERLAALSPAMEADRAVAKQFLYVNFYNSPGMEEPHHHAAFVVEGLFASIMDDPSLLPDDHQAQIPTEGLARTVADYIAGMTDSYIEQLWAR